MSEVNVIGIDLAKDSFWVAGINHRGRVVKSEKTSRERLISVVEGLSGGCVIAMEACSGSHHWGREFARRGYEVRLISPQFVVPYVKGQKNDRNDAEAIAEAGSRESIRTVPVKPVEQQDIQCMHRVREQYMKQRTAKSNELRGLLSEYGIVFSQGQRALRVVLEEIAAGKYELSAMVRELMVMGREDLRRVEERLVAIDRRLALIAKQNDACRRLMTIPGFGYVTATAFYAALAHMEFKNGRNCAAFLGLVPRQHSTGGKAVLGRISKRGNKYLRSLLVHGARSVLLTAKRHTDHHSTWVQRLVEDKGYAKAAVAVANKNARIAAALLARGGEFTRKGGE